MAGVLNAVYAVAVLVVALAGVAFLLARPRGTFGETRWAQYGELIAVAVFLVAMVGTLLIT